MSLTIGNVVRSILADVDSDAGELNIAYWVWERYAEACGNTQFRHLRQEAELLIPAPISAGLISSFNVTNGRQLNLDGTANSAIPMGELTGYFITIKNTMYRAVQHVGTTLLLETAYIGSTLDTDVPYQLVKRYYQLPENCRSIGDIFFPRRNLWIEWLTVEELDDIAPDRRIGPLGPTFACEVNACEGRKTIELYPYPTQAEALRYVYYVRPTMPSPISLETQLPSFFDLHDLKEGALVNVYHRKMVQAAEKGQADIAAFWGNIHARQRTVWMSVIAKLGIKGRLFADERVIFGSERGTHRHSDVTTARSEIFARGRRP